MNLTRVKRSIDTYVCCMERLEIKITSPFNENSFMTQKDDFILNIYKFIYHLNTYDGHLRILFLKFVGPRTHIQYGQNSKTSANKIDLLHVFRNTYP